MRDWDAKRHPHRNSRGNKTQRAKEPRVTGVTLKIPYIDLIGEKAAEKGMSKQVLFEELIDKYLDKVEVWT